MVTGIVLLIVGITIGFFITNTKMIHLVGKLIDITIFILLFFLGISVGVNDKIISNFDSIGLQAFLVTLAATVGSIAVSVLVYHLFFKNTDK
ncbi:MAG: LysO family transporter [Bacteroidales bacterium]